MKNLFLFIFSFLLLSNLLLAVNEFDLEKNLAYFSEILRHQNGGTPYAWGDNYSGHLGNGTWDSSNVPVQVLNLTDVIGIAGGISHSLAISSTCEIPSCATNPNPSDGAIEVSTTPTLSWSSITGATSYEVYFGTSSNPPYVTNVLTNSYSPGTLNQGTTYYWKIIPKNDCGEATGCSIWSFTTGSGISCPPDLGDVNENGTITSFDGSLVLIYVVNSIGLSPSQQCKADVNTSSNIISIDATYILQCFVGLCNGLPKSFKTSCQNHGNCP